MSETTTRHSILIVEDSLAYQELYEEVFEDDYEVTIVDNKIDATRLLRERQFDLALIDMRLKENEPENVDGLDVAELIRDLDLPMAMILKSGFPTDESKRVVTRMEKLNFFAVMDKSASNQAQKLITAVAKAVSN